MVMKKIALTLTTLFMAAGSASSMSAQESTQASEFQTERPSRIKREVQPIIYWVDAPTLHVRDNPVAGNIVRTLERGEKISVYSQYENWVLISNPENKPRWINSDFLSNNRISFASFDRNRRLRSSDVRAVRIKDPEDRKVRLFAVRLKTADTGNAVITTREITSQGNLYQNRFVSCDNKRVVGTRLIGEGSTFLAAQDDFRNYALDIFESEKINDKVHRKIDSAISAFACKNDAF